MFMASLEENGNLAVTIRNQYDAQLRAKDAAVASMQKRKKRRKRKKKAAAATVKTLEKESAADKKPSKRYGPCCQTKTS